MNQKTISFIIPSYNSENHLNICLDSFCNSTVFNDIEVLIINDGSKDHTAQIGQTYEKRYPKTFRVISKANGGHGSAINIGVNHAVGKWFRVVDSDDWVLTENLPKYVSILKSASADVVLTPYYTKNMLSGQKKAYQLHNCPYEVSVKLEKLINHWNDMENGFTLHGITYNTEFYKKNHHKLLEKVFFEDHEYATIPCCYAQNVLVADIFIYVYQIGNVNQSISWQNQVRRQEHLKKVLLSMMHYYVQNNIQMEKAGQQYFLYKLKIILLSYYKLLCLAEPDRKRGRRQVQYMDKQIQKNIPTLWEMTHKKQLVFILLNHLHISPQTYTDFLDGSIYKQIKKLKNYIKN